MNNGVGVKTLLYQPLWRSDCVSGNVESMESIWTIKCNLNKVRVVGDMVFEEREVIEPLY